MKLLWIGGDHPRHLYYFNRIRQEFQIHGALIEKRESMKPRPPDGLSRIDWENFVKHFDKRDEAESKHFGEQHLPDSPEFSMMEVRSEDLNGQPSAHFLKSINPDMVLIFGCALIRAPLFNALPRNSINLHLGLSPRYRGAATLFWPFYFLEPNHAGCTFHYIISEPDAGDVIHQMVPQLEPGDGIHDVACKAVIDAAEAAVTLLRIFDKEGTWRAMKQRFSGKNFQSSDFRPEHLRVIYNLYDDDIVRHYIEGALTVKSPNLLKQFET